VLVIVQREASDVADRADEATLVATVPRLGTVLDHRHLVLAAECHDRVHVGRVARMVDNDDRPSSRREPGGDRLGGHVVGPRIDVGEDRHGILVQSADEAAGVGQHAGDHLVAGRHADRPEGDVKRRRAARAGHGVLLAVGGGHLGAERPDLLPVGIEERVLLERFTEFFQFVAAESLPGAIGCRLGPRPAVDGQLIAARLSCLACGRHNNVSSLNSLGGYFQVSVDFGVGSPSGAVGRLSRYFCHSIGLSFTPSPRLIDESSESPGSMAMGGARYCFAS